VIQDISERKQAEIALRDSEEKFRSVIEQSEDGVSITDLDGRILIWNSGLEKICGRKAEECVGSNIWDIQFGLVPPQKQTRQLHEHMRTLFASAYNNGKTSWFNIPFIHEIIAGDGTGKIIETVAFPIKTESGAMIGSFTRDITSRKQAEAELGLKPRCWKRLRQYFPPRFRRRGGREVHLRK